MMDKAALNDLLSKNGRGRRDARRRREDPDGVRDQRAAGLFDHEGRPQDGALSILSSVGHGVRERLRARMTKTVGPTLACRGESPPCLNDGRSPRTCPKLKPPLHAR